MRTRSVAALVALLCLLVVVASARAAEPVSHPFLGTISPLPPPGGPGPLKDACGVAIAPGGEIFVSNYYDHSIFVFTSEHEFLERIPIQEPPLAPTGKPFDGPCDLAFDSAGNLFVNNWHSDVVELAHTGSETFAPAVVIDPNPSTGIAVDPATDNLLVDERTRIVEYASPLSPGEPPVRTIGAGSIGNGFGVAISSFPGNTEFPSTAGRVYVADAADGAVKVFDPEVSLTAPVEVIDGDATPRAGFNDLEDTDLAVDPLDGHLYVVDNLQPGFERPEAVVYEFSSRGHYRGTVPTQVASGHESNVIDAEPSGLAIDGSGDLYLTSGNYFNDGTILNTNAEVQIFGPAAQVITQILTVSKSGTGAGTVSSEPPGLRCGTACEGEFTRESNVTLTATGDPHNRFVRWFGCPAELSKGRCSVTMDSDQSVGAEFEPVPQLTLTVETSGSGTGAVTSMPAGINCPGACQGEFDQGSQVDLTATPAAGNRLVGWSGCDAEPGPETCQVTLTAARSVTAEFERVAEPPAPPPPSPSTPQRILTVASTGLGTATGTVTSAPPGIDCGGTCSNLYADGTMVTLTAQPAGGSDFIGWGGCDSVAGARCTVQLGSDKTVVAAFGPGSPGPLRFGKATLRGRAVLLRVAVPVPGELSASGPRLRPVSVLPLVAGQVGLRLRLNPAGARALGRNARHRLEVPVALFLAPFDGGSTVRATKKVIFTEARRQ